MLCCSAARTAVPWVLAAHRPSRYARLMARPKSTIPRYKRRRSQPLLRRLWKWLIRLTLIFVLGSILWALAYRFINPPITFTMLDDVVAGRGGAARGRVPAAQDGRRRRAAGLHPPLRQHHRRAHPGRRPRRARRLHL